MLEEAKQFETNEQLLATNRRKSTEYMDWLHEMLHTVKDKNISLLIELYEQEIEWVRENYTIDPCTMDTRRSSFEKRCKEFYV